MTAMSHNSIDSRAISTVEAVGLSGSELAIAMLAQSKDCIKIFSVDGHLEFMNCNGLNAMEIDQLGWVIGKFWWDLWPSALLTLVKEHFYDAVQGGVVNFEAECPTAKGSRRLWAVNLRPLCAQTGQVVSILCTSQDITSGGEQLNHR
ncbi:PAS domain-containing protein [Qipengyuania sp. YG27]|uniref:PAS domain-containing protein n=1 Tax=Qipengyuania mesophila TaxID=2867246 RepID=A0ABS7JX89_9SPHN|nr:PAS domain-containing protein [Qipengyuania mesophila]MBX7502183.1 PAS domain-containing protein [Qipengyuania mesophila]